MAETGFKLRSEAGVVAWGALTEEQREAGKQVHGLLREMAVSTEKVDKPKPSFLPRLDKTRHNRVLLIDGGRGSGKTELLLTVLDFWRSYFLDEQPKGAPVYDDVDALHPDIKASYSLRGRVVPVGLLDLHPLPPSTNLLFHIIGRFERVVEWLEEDGKAEHQPAAWHFSGSSELDSRKTWQGLLKAAAAGWDGNVKERGARLDLEAYAMELEESERQRLNVVDTFAAFLDALVKDFPRRCNLNKPPMPMPLFVLAVDDADMDPSRSVELLETVRMLWHPRLAFVLTGHSELFVHTLAEHFLGELRQPLKGSGVVASELVGLVENRPHLRLANDVYEKIIPTGHRCRVLPISPPQVMTVEVLEGEGA